MTHRLRGAIIVAVFGVVAIAATVFTPQVVFAAVGDGGDGTGGGGPGGTGWTTNNGHGWYMFGSAPGDAGPYGLQHSRYEWSAVKAQCRAENAQNIMAYVVMRDPNRINDALVFTGVFPESWPGWRGNWGPPWYTADQARSMFNSLPLSQRRGYSIGVDVGWFCYNYRPPRNFTITGTTTVSRTTARPGDVVQWTHTLRNGGPTTTAPTSIYSNVASSGFSNTSYNGQLNVRTGVMAAGVTRDHPDRIRYTVTRADVGRTLCQQLRWIPTSSSGVNSNSAANACVTVGYDYNLVPGLSVDGGSSSRVVEDTNRPVAVQGNVENTGTTKSEPNITWRLSEIRWAPGTSPSGPVGTQPEVTGGEGGDACAYFTGYVASSCKVLEGETEVEGYGQSSLPTGSDNPPSQRTYDAVGNIDDVPPGTKICYVMSVQPYRQGSTNWRHSQLVCLIVGKLPKLQVLGGSVQVGRTSNGILSDGTSTPGVMGSIVTKASESKTFGSWVEYGILATGEVQKFGSASGLSEGNASPLQGSWSNYTFTAPDSPSGEYGHYVFGNTILPDVTAAFSPSTAVQVLNANFGNILAEAKGRNVRPAILGTGCSVPVGGGSLGQGEWLVINADGCDVIIEGNVTYTDDDLHNTTDIPQLIIIADNITIKDTVTRVDAWLIARSGAISTCDHMGSSKWLSANYETSASALTLGDCSQRLTINGPVIANQLYLRRTHGSGSGDESGNPAEIINFRPDALLWAKEHMSPAAIYQTVNERELPPRY